jgi:hypothetical protein
MDALHKRNIQSFVGSSANDLVTTLTKLPRLLHCSYPSLLPSAPPSFCTPVLLCRQYTRCSLFKTSLMDQYNETNVMHFSFNLLRIKGLYMFRALLAHSLGGADIRTQHTKCRLCSDPWEWKSTARNMQRPLILNKLNEKCITLVS